MPLVVNIEVKDIDNSLSSISENGGKIVVPKMSIPGVGYSAYFKDPDGVIMGLFQPDPGGE